MSGVCAGCMSRERLRCLSEATSVEGETCPYADMFIMCFNLHIVERPEDAREHFVCERCATRLTEACEFRAQVQRTQALLLQARVIKKEEVDAYEESVYPFQEDQTMEGQLEEPDPSTQEGASSLWLKTEEFDVPVETQKADRSHKKRSRKKHMTASDHLSAETKKAISMWFQEKGLDAPQRIKRKYRKRIKNEQYDLELLSRKEEKRQAKKKEDLPMDAATLTCKLCQKSYENILVLRRHMAEHFPEHLCDICGTVFRKLDHLKVHLMTHRMVQCPECDRVMKQNTLKKHIEYYHNKKKRIFRCMTCLETFNSLILKRAHMREAHGVENDVKCDICNKSFGMKSNLQFHIRFVHQKESNVFCMHCGKGFINEYALKRHMLKHTGIRNHVCPVCQKAYLKKDTLTAHMKIHNSVKDFVCSICAKCFTYKCSLKGHMKTHHPHVNFDV